ncbi:MAG: ABC transporter permease subunit, partial [Gammaproteobacteria bacterium]|nr:ABC transporter permease subunit [Gammaproteobacteria bacterium]
PLAFVFIVIFLVVTGAFTFYFGRFYERGQADLQSFFVFHPFLYLFFVPAIAMRLWAEERKTGTLELLMTLPITLFQAVIGKFLAAWAVLGIALLMTFPIWITVNFLGNPDNGTIVAAYIGSFLLAGGFLAIGSCLSAVTRNQVIAFVVAVTVSFIFLFSGFPMVLNFFNGWMPQILIDTIASFSFYEHFNAIVKGVIDLRDLVFFVAVILFWLMANAIVLDMKKAD